MKKVLLCGQKSFASKGLREMLEKRSDLELFCFSRGEEAENGNEISGDVYSMLSNPFLKKGFDVVVNYIYISDCDVEKNLNYLRSLVAFCKQERIKQLIHLSTISVYANDLKYANEETDIERDANKKGLYSALKVLCDKYLESEENEKFHVTYIRPGFIVEDRNVIRLAGILVTMPLNMGLLMGNKKTSLPLVNRRKMNEAMVKIILNDNPDRVYLMLENKKGTKYQYVKDWTDRRVICLPKWLSIFSAKTLKLLHVFNENKVELVKGLFKDTYFDSSNTEKSLNIKF